MGKLHRGLATFEVVDPIAGYTSLGRQLSLAESQGQASAPDGRGHVLYRVELHSPHLSTVADTRLKSTYVNNNTMSTYVVNHHLSAYAGSAAPHPWGREPAGLRRAANVLVTGRVRGDRQHRLHRAKLSRSGAKPRETPTFGPGSNAKPMVAGALVRELPYSTSGPTPAGPEKRYDFVMERFGPSFRCGRGAIRRKQRTT